MKTPSLTEIGLSSVMALGLTGCPDNKALKEGDPQEDDAHVADTRADATPPVEDAYVFVDIASSSEPAGSTGVHLDVEFGVSKDVGSVLADVGPDATPDMQIPDATLDAKTHFECDGGVAGCYGNYIIDAGGTEDAAPSPEPFTIGAMAVFFDPCLRPPVVGDCNENNEPECCAIPDDGGTDIQQDAAEHMCIAGNLEPHNVIQHWRLDSIATSAVFATFAQRIFNIPDGDFEDRNEHWYDHAYHALIEAGLAPWDEISNANNPPSEEFMRMIQEACDARE